MSAVTLPATSPEALEEALALLRAGAVIAFPTDTVYGVGAAGLNPAAIAQLYTVKARPLSQPIPLLLADPEDLGSVSAAVPSRAAALAARYWPGGLTLVVPAARHLPSILLAGGSTVAVRVPDHAWVRELIRRLGQPLAATSANLHGGPNPASAAMVLEQLGSNLPLVVDGGPTPGDIASTIVDVTGSRPVVLRQGALQIDL
ncbi:MAG TPA: L-threonylcarbamoyladenylate synthase [Herpetosiphonaceae bacterium]|nr:L-threonylcarbamoyladenylate synthase [Herpetosiphonaceae bacterium]